MSTALDLLKAQPSGAIFSDDRAYRYLLWRVFDSSKPVITFIGLNPSKAGETENDHTIRRELYYARVWGFGALLKVNMFGFCSTDPKGLLTASDAVGPANDFWLRAAAYEAERTVAAWGANKFARERVQHLLRTIECDLYVLGLTKDGSPKHPARLTNHIQLVKWNFRKD